MTEGRRTPTRQSRKRRRRQGQSLTDGGTASGRTVGAPVGTPRFLRVPKAEAADVDSAAEREARQTHGAVSERPTTTPLGRAAADAISADTSTGQALASSTKERDQAGPAIDLDAISVHPESPIAVAFGANAITYGHHIHFAPGAYRPGSARGDALINHELTHVAQQARYGGEGAQFDLMIGGMDTGLGWFDINMPTATIGSQTGLRGTITFTPSEDSPYSNRIGLIQTVDIDTIAADGTATDADWSTTREADRENVKTPSGEHVDMRHDLQPDTHESEPWYWQNMSGNPNVGTEINHFGWNRGGGDLHDTQLWDFPASNFHDIYDFETVAVGRDSEVVYGALNWGFEVDGPAGTVTNEYANETYINASGTGEQHQSEVFDDARGRFRDFYIHEPEIVYFDADQSVPQPNELAKLSDAAAYLAAHPDVDIELAGSADTRGSDRYNRALALRRIDTVEAHLIAQGVPANRIHRLDASAGESSAEGSQGALASSAGSLQANRRVTLRYQRMMSLPAQHMTSSP